MLGEWEKKVLFNGNTNMTVEGTLVGSPQQLVAYIHSCGVCLNDPKQMIAQPLLIMKERTILKLCPISMQKTGIFYMYILILRKKRTRDKKGIGPLSTLFSMFTKVIKEK